MTFVPPLTSTGERENRSDGERLAILLWGEGSANLLYEVQTVRTSRRRPVPYEDALRKIRSGEVRFLGIVPRKSGGNTKAHCVDSHDVLWVDVDHPGSITAEDALRGIHPKLDRLGLPPSAIVYSGRAGLHIYWKLAEPIPIEQVEAYNGKLAEALDGDKGCRDRTRYLRVPGTINEKPGGSKVALRHFKLFLVPPDDLPAKLGNVAATPAPGITQGLSRQARPDGGIDQELAALAASHSHWGERAVEPDEVLNPPALKFLRQRPARGWSSDRYKSRSEMEMAIVCHLVRKGWSDRQIQELADRSFPRHQEQHERKPTDPDWYLDTTIRGARRRLLDKHGLISSPKGGNPRTANPKKRAARPGDDYDTFELAMGQRKADLVIDVMSHLGCARRTAYRRIQKLVQWGALVEGPGKTIDRSKIWLDVLEMKPGSRARFAAAQGLRLTSRTACSS